jgi:hypothetical protein
MAGQLAPSLATTLSRAWGRWLRTLSSGVHGRMPAKGPSDSTLSLKASTKESVGGVAVGCSEALAARGPEAEGICG